MSHEEPIRSSMDAVYREHRAMCLDAAYQVTHDRDAAEDAVQNVFVRLRPKRIESVPEEKRPAYLARAAKNAARDILRTGRRRRERPLTDAVVQAIREYRNGPEEDVVAAERRKLVRAMIERLPENCREVMCLIVYEGLTYREVTERLQISLKGGRGRGRARADEHA